VLKKFADSQHVEYNLLSDVDSAVIKEFGILNTLIEPDNSQQHPSTQRRFYGVPFPGVYVVDEQGVVTEKFFYRHYGTRASAGSILNSALGKVLIPKEAPQQDFRNDQVKVTAFLADPELRLEYMSNLYVRFELEEGLHIYGGEMPDGYIATEVSVAGVDGIRAADPIYPATKPMAFSSLGVTLNVYEGVVDVTIPITANAESLNWNKRDKPDSIDVQVQVRYQVCSDTICHLPQEKTLTVTIPLGQHVMPGR